MEDLLINAEMNNECSIKLFFKSGKTKILNINNIINSSYLSETEKRRWSNMIEKGLLNNFEINLGDLIWPGWCEILSQDLNKFL